MPDIVKTVVRFLKRTGGYNGGDIAGFEPHIAQGLISGTRENPAPMAVALHHLGPAGERIPLEALTPHEFDAEVVRAADQDRIAHSPSAEVKQELEAVSSPRRRRKE
jgi:hypothetical protein